MIKSAIADDSGHFVYVYDTQGVLQMVLADEENEGLDRILVIMTEDRADASAMELVAFKLSGF